MVFHKRLQLRKTFFLLLKKWIPDKTQRIEACLTVCRHTVFGGALIIAKALTLDEARRIASNVAKLPALLAKER